ncbi:MAG: transcriptional repressor [Deinococcota bacterium]|nr:transcriptional repressor [Deinococcota bacterium]
MAQARDKGSRDILQRHGLRFSRPRAAILGFFGEQDSHVSAELLYAALRERGENISLSTVYLNLSVLRSVGLIREFDGLHGEALYDSNVAPHYHLICKDCGAILDLPLETLEGQPPAALLRHSAERLSGWQVDEPKLDFHGYCPQCRPAPVSPRPGVALAEPSG